MKRPISAGDDCRVVGGLGRHKSPNLRLQVRVVSLEGEHSQHGRMWRCEGPGVKQMNDNGTYVVTGWACFATSWLERLDPVAPGLTTTTEEGITA